MDLLRLEISPVEGEPLCRLDVDGPVELGRQRRIGEPLHTLIPEAAAARVNIAPLDQTAVPRECLRVELAGPDRAYLKNLHTQHHLHTDGGVDLWPRGELKCQLPAEITVGNVKLRFESRRSERSSAATILRPERGDDSEEYHTLMRPTAAPRRPSIELPADRAALSGGAPESRWLVEWFQSLTNLLQQAVSSEEFFHGAAQAVVELLNLDSSRVLLWKNQQWQVVAAAEREEINVRPRSPSQRMLDRLRTEKRTFWHRSLGDDEASLTGVQTVVAAPILNQAGDVIGALYADRASDGRGRGDIAELDAMLIETIASSVAAGIARLEQQQAAVAAQVRFEQFFTPELSQYLANQPDLLEGREAEVTLLFGDIRGFTRISERLTPSETMELVSAVMEAAAACVRAEQGVLVDFIGDGLLAMWGAPRHQPEHAILAARAACAMTKAVDALSASWEPRTGEPVHLSVGLNSGLAQVGNTGSSSKFKYGPLGNSVNIASRVQGATKHLLTPVLITEATNARLGSNFCRRRLPLVRVVNIDEPLRLYELCAHPTDDWNTLCRAYDEALSAYERGDLTETVKRMGALLAEHPKDGPSLVLINRALDDLVAGGKQANTVVDLPSK